jgi:hypothetical protein
MTTLPHGSDPGIVEAVNFNIPNFLTLIPVSYRILVDLIDKIICTWY